MAISNKKIEEELVKSSVSFREIPENQIQQLKDLKLNEPVEIGLLDAWCSLHTGDGAAELIWRFEYESETSVPDLEKALQRISRSVAEVFGIPSERQAQSINPRNSTIGISVPFGVVKF